jgi:hypothetical protein
MPHLGGFVTSSFAPSYQNTCFLPSYEFSYSVFKSYKISLTSIIVPKYVFLPSYELSYPVFSKQQKQLYTCYKISYAVKKRYAEVQNYTPRYEITYPNMKLHTQIWNYTHRYQITHPDIKLHTQISNYTPRYEITQLYMNYVPRYETKNLCMYSSMY